MKSRSQFFTGANMTRRFLLSLALAVVATVASLSQAQAGQQNLPSPLSTLETAGNYAIVGDLKFSNFSYVPTPSTAGPAASAVSVHSFTILPGETGISFNGAFAAAAGTTVDYAITYQVSTLDGAALKDAYLSLGGFVNNGGTGTVSIGETIFNTSGQVISSVPFQVYSGGANSDTTMLSGNNSTIIVQKDITVTGGSAGAVFSFTNQGFSTTMVPEPQSMGLLGIGTAGLLAFRRFFKRRATA